MDLIRHAVRLGITKLAAAVSEPPLQSPRGVHKLLEHTSALQLAKRLFHPEYDRNLQIQSFLTELNETCDYLSRVHLIKP